MKAQSPSSSPRCDLYSLLLLVPKPAGPLLGLVSSQEGRADLVTARELDGGVGPAWKPGCVAIGTVSRRSLSGAGTLHTGLLPSEQRDREAPFSEGLCPLCGGETVGVKTPLYQAAGMCLVFSHRETAPGFYGSGGHLKMSQTVRHIQNRVFKMTFCMSNVTFIF